MMDDAYLYWTVKNDNDHIVLCNPTYTELVLTKSKIIKMYVERFIKNNHLSLKYEIYKEYVKTEDEFIEKTLSILCGYTDKYALEYSVSINHKPVVKTCYFALKELLKLMAEVLEYI